MKKHVHCDVIKAMARGERVQMKNDSGRWISLTAATFRVDAEYRITPDDEIKHVHHDAMVAWADGHEIETLKGGGTGKAVWVYSPSPTFAPFLKYRSKPAVDKKAVLWQEMEALLERMKKLEKQYDEAFAL